MPLRLDLLRHGDAEPPADGGDAGRPLSREGRADLERLAARLGALGWRPDRAFTSPLLRARETAAIVLAAHAPGLAPEPLPELLPDAEPAALVAALSARGVEAGHALLVGHQPLLGRLALHLCGGREPGFTPGTLLAIAFAGPAAAGAGVPGVRLRPEDPE